MPQQWLGWFFFPVEIFSRDSQSHLSGRGTWVLLTSTHTLEVLHEFITERFLSQSHHKEGLKPPSPLYTALIGSCFSIFEIACLSFSEISPFGKATSKVMYMVPKRLLFS